MDGLLLEGLRAIRRIGRDGVSSGRRHAVFGRIRRDTQGKVFFQPLRWHETETTAVLQ